MMNQKENTTINTQPCYRKVIGNTTYVVRVHFSETAKETLEDKIKRLVRGEVVRSYASEGNAHLAMK
ncbi:MAG: transposon-encoded TnpW family protein [Oscillospiraceae bacterium]|nr:transposon-encoded TnpW family protein [Oscillospiraceae bacterium]